MHIKYLTYLTLDICTWLVLEVDGLLDRLDRLLGRFAYVFEDPSQQKALFILIMIKDIFKLY